jgi:hypothetical protein
MFFINRSVILNSYADPQSIPFPNAFVALRNLLLELVLFGYKVTSELSE